MSIPELYEYWGHLHVESWTMVEMREAWEGWVDAD